jgi:hypothetical protein
MIPLVIQFSNPTLDKINKASKVAEALGYTPYPHGTWMADYYTKDTVVMVWNEQGDFFGHGTEISWRSFIAKQDGMIKVNLDPLLIEEKVVIKGLAVQVGNVLINGVVQSDGIQVGCSFVPKAKVQEAYKAMFGKE